MSPGMLAVFSDSAPHPAHAPARHKTCQVRHPPTFPSSLCGRESRDRLISLFFFLCRRPDAGAGAGDRGGGGGRRAEGTPRGTPARRTLAPRLACPARAAHGDGRVGACRLAAGARTLHQTRPLPPCGRAVTDLSPRCLSSHRPPRLSSRLRSVLPCGTGRSSRAPPLDSSPHAIERCSPSCWTT